MLGPRGGERNCGPRQLWDVLNETQFDTRYRDVEKEFRRDPKALFRGDPAVARARSTATSECHLLRSP